MIDNKKFSKDAIKKMKDMIKFTVRFKKETGGILCSDDNNKINLENICEGTICSVKIEDRKCPNNREDVGTYHTHHTISGFYFYDDILPSSGDISGKKFVCIGQKIFVSPFDMKGTEKIRCLDLKDKKVDNVKRDLNRLKIRDKEDEFMFKTFGIGLKNWKKMMKEHIDKYYYKFDPEELVES